MTSHKASGERAVAKAHTLERQFQNLRASLHAVQLESEAALHASPVNHKHRFTWMHSCLSDAFDALNRRRPDAPPTRDERELRSLSQELELDDK